MIQGLKREIGNGCNTKVWLHKWVDDPIEGLKAPWIKNTSFDVLLKVGNLINPVTRRWDMQALQDLFVLGDVDLITRKQPVLAREDFFSWRFNKSGNFSVKSAYWLACDLKTKMNHPEVLALPSVNPLKDQVWKVKTVPKIRIFLWKVLNEALPVASALMKRGMKTDQRCQTCGFEGEDINHVLFTCHVARQAWAMSEIPSAPNGFHPSSIYENINYLFGLLKNRMGVLENKRAWPWLLWRLWKSRNEFFFEGKRRVPGDIASLAKVDSEEWHMAQIVDKEMEHKLRGCLADTKAKWRPPPEGWLMCNIAWNWKKKDRTLGVAWVIRDHRGVVTIHSRRSFVQVLSLEDAKLQALLWSSESITSLRLNKVIFAGEFSELFGAVRKPLEWPAFLSQRDEFIKSLEGLVEWKVIVISKEANRGASFIADSVHRLGFVQSYVASGQPVWLDDLFRSESLSL